MSDWRDDEYEAPQPPEQNEGVRILGAESAGPPPGPADESWSASGQGWEPPPARDPSGPMPLPHWTEPPTGEVPRILGDEPAGSPDDDLESWSALSSPPRFRSDAGDWAEGDFAAGELEHDESTAIGALADSELDEHPVEAPTRRRGRRSRRRSTAAARPAGPVPPPEPPPGPGMLEGPPPPTPAETGGPTGVPADLSTRVVTAAVLAAVALICFALGRPATTFLVMVIVGVAAFELYEGFRRAGYHVATVLGLLGCVAIVPIAYNEGEQAFGLVTVLMVIFALLWYLAEVVHARPTVNVALTLFGYLYIGFVGAYAALLLSAPNGIGLILGVVLTAIASDVVGYFVGSRAGRTALLPRVSPHKTVEGLVGGMIAAIVVGAIVGMVLHPWDGLGDGLLLGIVVAVTAPLGDLCESMIKRDLGIKDFGTFLPGHGGVMDRFDAILFTLPAAYYLALHLNIG